MLLPVDVIRTLGTETPCMLKQTSGLPRRNFGTATSKLNKCGQTLVTVTFTSSTTWTAPERTYWVEGALRGGTGYSGSAAYDYYYVRTVVYGYNASNGTQYVASDTTSYGGSGTAPQSYCSGPIAYPDVCYYYTQYSDPGSDPTWGNPSSAFGQTSAGGYGGAQGPEVAIPFTLVQPGQSYDMVVGSGGSITISYYR